MKCCRLLALLPLLLVAGRASAQVPHPLITVDEFGNGTFQVPGATIPLHSSIMADPGPGGLPNVLTYVLPVGGILGDVGLTDDGVLGDVIRFNEGTLVFYSDSTPQDPADAPGDTPSPPQAAYTNHLTIPEAGSENSNGAFYTPDEGQPGWNELGPTYHFISDGVVPEPGSLALLATGGLPLLGFLRRRRLA